MTQTVCVKSPLFVGELWEYDPAKGSWVRRAADATPTMASERDLMLKKDKSAADIVPEGDEKQYLVSLPTYDYLCH